MYKIVLLSLIMVISLQAKYVKVFYAENFKSEGSEIQPYADLVLNTNKNKFSLAELYRDGWTLNNVLKTSGDSSNLKVMIFMDIEDKKFMSLDGKYK